MEDPVVPLERNLYGHPLAGPLWERQFEKVLLKCCWEKVSNWECLFEEMGSVGELSHKLFSRVCIWLVLGDLTLMVCEKTYSCGHKIEKSLRQTLGAFDLVHSSHK